MHGNILIRTHIEKSELRKEKIKRCMVKNIYKINIASKEETFVLI